MEDSFTTNIFGRNRKTSTVTNPGRADLRAGLHQAPGRRAGAHGCRSSGGHARKAAAADVAVVGVVIGVEAGDVVGVMVLSPEDFSSSAATLNNTLIPFALLTRRKFRGLGFKWSDTRTLESFWRATEES